MVGLKCCSRKRRNCFILDTSSPPPDVLNGRNTRIKLLYTTDDVNRVCTCREGIRSHHQMMTSGTSSDDGIESAETFT